MGLLFWERSAWYIIKNPLPLDKYQSVTKIFWDEAQRTSVWGSRMYELLVYEDDSAGSKPVISLTTEQVSYRADNLP